MGDLIDPVKDSSYYFMCVHVHVCGAFVYVCAGHKHDCVYAGQRTALNAVP